METQVPVDMDVDAVEEAVSDAKKQLEIVNAMDVEVKELSSAVVQSVTQSCLDEPPSTDLKPVLHHVEHDSPDEVDCQAMALAGASYHMNTMPELPVTKSLKEFSKCPECHRNPRANAVVTAPDDESVVIVGLTCFENHVWAQRFPRVQYKAYEDEVKEMLDWAEKNWAAEAQSVYDAQANKIKALGPYVARAAPKPVNVGDQSGTEQPDPKRECVDESVLSVAMVS